MIYKERFPIELQWQTARNYVVEICNKLQCLQIPENKRYIAVIVLCDKTNIRSAYIFKAVTGGKLYPLKKTEILELELENKYEKLVYDEIELQQEYYTTLSKVRNYLTEKTGKYICYKHDYYLNDGKWYNLNHNNELIIKTKEKVSLKTKKERVIKSILYKEKSKANAIKKYNSYIYDETRKKNINLFQKINKYDTDLKELNQKLFDINKEIMKETIK